MTHFHSAVVSILALAGAGSAFAASSPATYTTQQYATRHAKGYVKTLKTFDFMMSAPRQTFGESDGPVPSSYSMRGKAGPVEDQGGCGSCWDFSLTSVLRGTMIMAGHDSGRLSFNYLLNCATDMQGCNGGDFTAAAWLVDPKGAPLYGADGPYTQQDGKCVSAPAAASAKAYHMLGATGGNPSFRDIAYVVGVLHRPVSIDVAVDDNWEFYSGGVYNGCSDQKPDDINHMVSIEGYDCGTSVDAKGNCVFDSQGNLPKGVGTWLIRNSWGTSWGDGGYITTQATDKTGALCNEAGADALYYDVE